MLLNSAGNFSNSVLRCWGKTDRNSSDPEVFHPALYHMLDVGFVAQAMLSLPDGNRWKRTLCELLQCEEEHIISWLPFLIALHDIGKISAAFQANNSVQKNRLQLDGYKFGKTTQLQHSQVGQLFFWYEWPDHLAWTIPENLRKCFREVTRGHHGLFSSPGELKQNRQELLFSEPGEWRLLRLAAFDILEKVFDISSSTLMPEPANISSTVMALTGFTTLCDWIGSDQRFYSPQSTVNIHDYVEMSMKIALEAIDADGFAQISKSDEPILFADLFQGAIPVPRPLQLSIDEISERLLTEPSLTIIEAPTGEGKTEAALALAHRIAAARGTDELYYALPTTATSDQMFVRVKNYLQNQLKLESAIKLVHGQAFLRQSTAEISPMPEGTKNSEEEVIDWFSSKKRALLAPFGVGTIDQIELAALNVRHASLRFGGLAGKVIILDEVHAYDTYMTTIIERLLQWLSEMGTSVILLSATLPQSRKRKLMDAFIGAHETEKINPTAYPAISVATKTQSILLEPKASQQLKRIGIRRLHYDGNDAPGKARWLVESIAHGGCVCWITNTVARAQDVFREVEKIVPEGVELMVLHSRFPLDQRRELEQRLTSLYGPNKDQRPGSGIVIGTQVLEQSLDLDFDVMVTDLAPVDLILQRAGRLHRHLSTCRPAELKEPFLYINLPLQENEEIQIQIDEKVYSEYFLRRTAEILENRDTLSLPQDFRLLVEKVYDPDLGELSGKVRLAYGKLLKEDEAARGEAALRLLPSPDPTDLFTGAAARLAFIEEEAGSNWMIAKTRMGEESITIIPLEDHIDWMTLVGDQKPIMKCLTAEKEVQLNMLQKQIRLSNPSVVKSILENETDLSEIFPKSFYLKNTFPLKLSNGECEVRTTSGTFSLRLDQKLGLVIEKKGGS